MVNENEIHVAPATLEAFATHIMQAVGLSDTDAQTVAWALVTANLAGAVLPMAGAKGYALALMIEILSAIVPGTSWGPHVRSPYDDWKAPTDAGLWCLAIHLAPLMSPEEYTARLGGMLAGLREMPPAPGQSIRIPGERRAQMRAARTIEGIPMDAATRKELDALAAEVGIEPLEWT
jgi:LDH2 family malate/lactate/ureidoglycolate dehydrogenase